MLQAIKQEIKRVVQNHLDGKPGYGKAVTIRKLRYLKAAYYEALLALRAGEIGPPYWCEPKNSGLETNWVFDSRQHKIEFMYNQGLLE